MAREAGRSNRPLADRCGRVHGRLVICVVAAGACGRLSFDDLTVSDAASVDAGCWAAWAGPAPPNLTSPTKIVELDTTGYDADPELADGDLTIYYASYRGGGVREVMARRPSLDAAFGSATDVVATGSGDSQSKLGLAGSDVHAVIAAAMNSSGHLYTATRESDGTLSDLAATGFDTLGDDGQYDPYLTPDGLTLRFDVGAGGVSRIYETRRTALATGFGSATEIAFTGEPPSLSDPNISPDGLSMVLSSAIVAGSDEHVAFATRPDTSAAWAWHGYIDTINSNRTERDPLRSGDGCTLWFSSTREGANYEMYTSTVVP